MAKHRESKVGVMGRAI